MTVDTAGDEEARNKICLASSSRLGWGLEMQEYVFISLRMATPKQQLTIVLNMVVSFYWKDWEDKYGLAEIYSSDRHVEWANYLATV